MTSEETPQKAEDAAAEKGAPPDDTVARVLAEVAQRFAVDPRDPDAWFAQAAALAKAGNLPGAIDSLETLAKIDETYPGLWLLKTKFHVQRGELEKAKASREHGKEVERREEASQSVPTRSRETTSVRSCPACNAVVTERAAFCFACGTLLQSAHLASPPILRPASPARKPAETRPSRPGGGPRGRTNGLASGLRGRTNGLASGVTNGFVNGFRTARAGLTNGLTNGNGFTNGIGSVRFQQEANARKWRLHLIPVLAVLLLCAPLLAPEAAPEGIRIDGDFADWRGVRGHSMTPGAGANADVDVTHVALVGAAESLSLLVQVRGQAFAGEPSPGMRTDAVFVFVEVDGNAGTGYPIRSLGADRLLVIRGRNETVTDALAYRASPSADPRDWRTWSDPAYIAAASSAGQLEVGVDWLLLGGDRASAVFLVATMGWDGTSDFADYHLKANAPVLLVVQRPIAPQVLSGPNVPLLAVELTARDGPVSVTGMTVGLLGTAPTSVIASLTLVDGQGVPLAQRIPVSRQVAFSFPSVTVEPDTSQTWIVSTTIGGAGNQTLGSTVSSPDSIRAGEAAVTLRTVPVPDPLGYVEGLPAAADVDGGYAEWATAGADGAGEATTRGDLSVDLDRFAVSVSPMSFAFYARLHGPAFAGDVLPTAPTSAPSTTREPDRDRDTVPDALDPLPDDFDNDGVADGQEGGDQDGDGLVDYTYGGPDRWLNTTVPATFPAPYAGAPVSVYIGPSTDPLMTGEDVFRLYVDADNSTGTGFSVGEIGADVLIEVRGREGVIASAAVMDHAGAPWSWSWTHRADLAFALGLVELEGIVDVSATGTFYVEISAWDGAGDALGPTTRGNGLPLRAVTRGATRPPRTLDITGNQKYYLRDTNHGTEAACGSNKVASTTQGSGPVRMRTLGAGQDACWYLDATTGQTIQSGSWESLLDVSLSTYSVAIVAFNTGTGTSPLDVVIGFQAKAMLLWYSGRTGTGDSAGGGTHQRGVGFATSTNDGLTVCSQSEDGSSSSNTHAGHLSDAVICSISTSGAFDGHFDISAIDSDSVTFATNDGFPSDYRVHGLFLGGTGLTNAATGTFIEHTGTGNQNIQVTGSFQPEAVFLASAMANSDPPGVLSDSSMMFGFAAGSGNPTDVVWSGGSDDNSPTSQTMTYARTGESIALFDTTIPNTPSSSDITGRAEVDAWNSDGFRLNWNERQGSRRIHYLALDGLSGVVGDFTTSTSTDTDITESGFGFSPIAAMFLSAANPEDSADAPRNVADEWSLGAFTSATSRGAQGTRDNDDAGTMTVGTILEHDEVYAHTTTADAIEGLVDIQSVDTEGFTLNQDDPDPAANYVGYIALGAKVTYDIYIQIWDKSADSVRATIGSCVGVTAVGDDQQCLISSVAQQTVGDSEVVRIRVLHSGSTGTVSIDFDDGDATGDSRATIPSFGIPEFQVIVLPTVGPLVALLFWRWSTHRKRAGRAHLVSG